MRFRTISYLGGEPPRGEHLREDVLHDFVVAEVAAPEILRESEGRVGEALRLQNPVVNGIKTHFSDFYDDVILEYLSNRIKIYDCYHESVSSVSEEIA